MSDDNALIKMVEIENRGRALVSCRPLKAGEIVLKDSPIVLYSAFPLPAAGNYCSHCFRTISPHSSTAVCCPHCSTASLFCSPECQSVALATSHTPFVCQALTRLRAADSPVLQHHHDRHVQARFLIAAYNLAMVSPSVFRLFFHFKFGFSVELTSALLAKDKLNAFGLMEPFDQDKERFDYVDSASDFSNTDIVVRVIHDLPVGREICLSYFPVNLKYSERQQRLKEDYGFTCDCDRCNVEANWSDNEEEGEGEIDQEDEDMDEDADDDMGADLETTECGMAKENDDFPHAYFFMRYMCSRDNCGGTLAPLPPVDARPSTVMECNVCGNLSNCEEMDGNE
ncbi:Histone-lysine N-methyltransferase ASHR2 [Sesamum angolense]|uniref:Histone-lysine N-methyltransferase ASHR2 n=1 Tax=Sesamum angolense TaxID=2727404 RepID=A0AAE2BRN2_9LAMI|nr:Histone-lysine N-methyltransferase ASHR2 [Sesamum angolense]